MPIFEITGFSEGISREGVTFLQPSESFSELEDGFVYRQVLQSRKGVKQFATGGTGDYNLLVSKGFKPAETVITAGTVTPADSVNSATQVFVLDLLPARQSYIHISVTDSGVGALREIFARYTGAAWEFAGFVKTDGANSINEVTGEITVVFGDTSVNFGEPGTNELVLAGSDAITVDYQQLVDTSITTDADTTQSFTIPNAPLVRDDILIQATDGGGAVEMTISAAPQELIEQESPGDSTGDPTETTNLKYTPIAKSTITMNINDGTVKQAVATYTDDIWVASGDATAVTVNENTGAVVFTWSPVLNANFPFSVDYFVNDGACFTTFIIDENKGNSDAGSEQNKTATNKDILRSVVTIDNVDGTLGVLQIVATWNGTTRVWDFTGDIDTNEANAINETSGLITVFFGDGGTTPISLDGVNPILISYETDAFIDRSMVNNINWATGATNLEFTTALSNVTIDLTYEFYPGTRMMGIFEHIKPNDDRVLLVTDKDFMYFYNETNNALEQVPFTSSDIITDFGITSNQNYISGTTYPKKDFSERFVFTGKEMIDIFYYDGFGISRFTNAIDNNEFEAFGSPSQTLTRAKHVFFYGERLNFLVPTLDGTTFRQGLLFSAIRTSGGSGDKFNTSGAGLVNFDTSDFITGWKKVSDSIFLTLYNSAWVVDKSRDNFNPYIVREVSTELGSTADFGTTGYENFGEAIGKEGIIKCDLREVLRTDSKIPRFARDEVDPDNMDLTYAGFDHENFSFLYSYLGTETNENIVNSQNRILFHNHEENTWSVFKQRFSCLGNSEVGKEFAWNRIDGTVKIEWSRWDTTEETWNTIGVDPLRKKDLAGDDNGFLFQINQDFDDYTVGIFGISKAGSAVITVPEHSFIKGDRVRIENVEGMIEINTSFKTTEDNTTDTFFVVESVTVNTIVINEVTTGYTTYARSGTISKVIDFSATLNEFNPWREKGIGCYLKEIEFQIDTGGGSLRIDISDNSSKNPWREDILVLPTSTIKERQYVKLSVENVADFHTIRMRQTSAVNQVKITSIRILAEPAGPTND